MFAASKSGRASGGGPAPTTDATFGYVPLLLETGSASSLNTTVTDSSASPNTVTRVSNPSTGWVSPYQTDGYWGNQFNGSTDYLSVANATSLQLASSLWTIEGWFYVTAGTGTDRYLLVQANGFADPNVNWILRVKNTNVIRVLLLLNGGASNAFVDGTTTVNLNTWYYIAASCDGAGAGANLRLWVNGNYEGGTTFNSSQVNTNAANTRVMAWPETPTYTAGYASNVRILKGTALYTGTGTITVPTTPLTPITNTSLLTCQSNRFLDTNTQLTPKTITPTGTPQVTPYFYPSGFTAPAASPGAALLNGTSQYLSVPSNAAFGLGTGDFTIECWIYLLAVPTNYPAIFFVGNFGVSPTGLFLNFRASGTIALVDSVNVYASSASPLVANTWYHVAAVRSSGSTKIYVNGVGGTAVAYAGSVAQNNLYIGYTGEPAQGYFNGYISNWRLVKGVAVYTSNFTLPTAPLAATQTANSNGNPSAAITGTQTSLLLGLADSNYTSATNGVQNNTFIDSSNYAFPITRNGTPTQGSITPYWPNGQWSNYFNGSTDYISATYGSAFSLGTNNFTIEFWVNFSSTAINQTVAVQNNSSNNLNWVIYTTAAGTLNYYLSSNGSTYNIALGVLIGSIFPNTWYHVALVRNGSVFTPYLNGVAGTTSTSSAALFASTSPLTLGASNIPNTYFNGYISNFRLVNGTAVYTANFTPPTTPLTAITNTSLLTCQSNRFRDNGTANSGQPFPITVAGTPRVQAFQPFSPTASYTTALYGGSGYFNSSTDYLSETNLTPITFGTGDFTIECWSYLISRTNNYPYIFVIAGNATSTNSRIQLFAGHVIFGTTTYQVEGASLLVNAGTIVYNTWTHLAVVRSSNTLTLYINGVSVGSASVTGVSFGGIGTGLRVMGNGVANEYAFGYLSNFRIVKGTAVYTGNFTPPTLAPLTTAGSTSAASYSNTTNVNTSFASSSTSLLLNFSNAGIYDAAVQNNVITVGNAQVSTAQSKWSPTSMAFDGSGDYLSNPIPSLNAAFTIEFWFYRNGTGNNYPFTIGDENNSTGLSVLISNAGANCIVFSNNATQITTTTVPATGAWTYIAVTRNSSNVVRLYINGTQVGGTWTTSATFANIIRVGAEFFGGSVIQSCNGYIQDFRITNGVARTITTPTAAFPTR
jgi:hypothetical protein